MKAENESSRDKNNDIKNEMSFPSMFSSNTHLPGSVPQWKRILNLACCVEQKTGENQIEKESAEANKSPAQLAREAAEFLIEPKKWKR